MTSLPEKNSPAGLLLFTGHRLDAPGRPEPRFPAAAEPIAEQMISSAVAREVAAAGGPVSGLAGGASGGDILFHEAAARLGVTTELCLALPPAEYCVRSVADAGAGWVARFEALCAALPIRLLPAEGPRQASIWEQANLWMLDRALELSAGAVCLLALWDGNRGDAPGGTADMVARARVAGARVVLLDAQRLLPA